MQTSVNQIAAKAADIQDRVRGSVLAQALGDALGAPFEFAEVGSVERVTGSDWIVALCPFTGQKGPHGPWISPAPIGIGTDDVRYNWLFMALAVELGRAPTDRQLARRLLDVHERPGDFFPGYEELARGQFAMWEGVSRGLLGQVSSLYPGISPVVLATRSVGLNYATMAGLLALPSVGLLFPGDPEGAYRAAYAAAFFDVAYAREATALLAAAQGLALGGMAPNALVEEVLQLDPLSLGGYFGRPYIVENLPLLLEKARGRQGRELADFLSRELRHFSVFDPYRALAIVFAALLAHVDEPLLAMQVAVNHFDLMDDGRWNRYADIDCYAGIAGTLLGAVYGAAAFPEDMLERVIESNHEVYGFDLEESIDRFTALVLARNGEYFPGENS